MSDEVIFRWKLAVLRFGLNLLTLTLFACCLCCGNLARPNEQPDLASQPEKPKPVIRKPGTGKPSAGKSGAGKPPAGKPSPVKPDAGKSAGDKSASDKSGVTNQSAPQKPAKESSSGNTDGSRSTQNPAAAARSTDRIAVTFSPTIVPVFGAGPRFRIWFANGDRITIHQPAFDHDHVSGVSLLLNTDAATPVRIPIAEVARIDQLGERTLKWMPEPQPITEPQTWDIAAGEKDLRVSFRAIAPQQLRLVFRLDQGKAPVAVQPMEVQTAKEQTKNDPPVMTDSLLTVLIDPQRLAVLQGTKLLIRRPLTDERVVSLALEPAGPAPGKRGTAASATVATATVADFLIVAVSPDSANPLTQQLLLSGIRARGVLGGDLNPPSIAESTASSSSTGRSSTPPFIVPGPSVRDRQRDVSSPGTDPSTNSPTVSAVLQLGTGDSLIGSPVGLTADGVTWRVAATSTPVTIPWTEILAVQLLPIEQQGDPVTEARTGLPMRKLISSNITLSDPEGRAGFAHMVDNHRDAAWRVSLLRPLGQFDTAGDRLALRNIVFRGSAADAPTDDDRKPIQITGEHAVLGTVSIPGSMLELLELDPAPGT